MIYKKILILICVISLFQNIAWSQEAKGKILKVAIFTEDKAISSGGAVDKIKEFFKGKNAESKEILNDFITSGFAQTGYFSVIDKNYTAQTFEKDFNGESGLESLQGTSALRLAQMLGADYLLIATITSVEETEKIFEGYGSKTKNLIVEMNVSVRLLDGNGGSSIYADTVSASTVIRNNEFLKQKSSNNLPPLIREASAKIVKNVSKVIEQISGKAKSLEQLQGVNFIINCDVENANVELDGAVIGVASGAFVAKPGLHSLKIFKERYSPWIKRVNIFADQIISVHLDKSDEGFVEDMKERQFESQMKRYDAETDAQTTLVEAKAKMLNKSKAEVKIKGNIKNV